MNNEIKEILDWLKDEDIYIEDYGYQYKRVSLKETKQLFNYITNLQQENHDLKSKLECYENGLYFSSEVDNLQQKLDKAIEYIQNHIIATETEDTLLNILQGGDE